MQFYQGDMFGNDYKGQIFIAKPGLWNCTIKEGTEVAIAYLDGDTGIARTEPFLTEFFVGTNVGRPVDVANTRRRPSGVGRLEQCDLTR